jgi:predicted tellurium resistance membrane protein TerC
VQIIILDVVFALDSIITAIGMAEHLSIMVTAVVIAMIVMLVAAGPVGDFVNRHPTVKMLALSFLLLVGMALIADGLHFHIPRGYLYFAIAFSAGVGSRAGPGMPTRHTDIQCVALLPLEPPHESRGDVGPLPRK